MKTSKIILSALVSTFMFVACEAPHQTADPAATETNEVQAYIYDNTSDVTIKPGVGDTVVITCSEGTFKKTELTFPIVVGRKVTAGEASFELVVIDIDEAFTYDKKMVYADGVANDTMWVTTKLGFGESADLIVMIPDSLKTSYGPQVKEIEVVVDYTWLSAGKALVTSGWEASSSSVEIQKAKEYSNEAGDMLYRLVSPYYFIAPSYCTIEGLHLNFYLDKDYNAKSLPMGYNRLEDTGYGIYWYPEWLASNYGIIESFTNVENVYYLTACWATDGGSLYNPTTEIIEWIDGYPGTISNPTDGDGEMQEIVFTDGAYIVEESVAHEILDELLYNADNEVFPESYVAHNLYTIHLTNALGGSMQLQLIGDALAGEYNIGTYGMTTWGYIESAAGLAVAGKIEGNALIGCMIDMTWNKFYLAAGSVVVKETEGSYSIAVDASSATGSKVKASYEGPLTDAAPMPAKMQGRKQTRIIGSL